MRRRRAEGRVAEGIAPYRKVMPYLMRGRNESAVLFELEVDVTKAEAFLAARSDRDEKATLFNVLMWCAVRTFAAYPKLNRFVAGGRIYDRDGIWISYSAKKTMEQNAPLVVVKRRFDPTESFDQLVRGMAESVGALRRDTPSRTDKELSLVLRAQGVGLRALMAVERFADSMGFLPRSYVEGDPLFASAFVANLGSLGMDSAYHHLYEYGSISIFCVMGRKRDAVAVAGGEVRVRPMVSLRFTYDERIEDGMYAHAALQHLKELFEDPVAGGISP